MKRKKNILTSSSGGEHYIKKKPESGLLFFSLAYMNNYYSIGFLVPRSELIFIHEEGFPSKLF